MMKAVTVIGFVVLVLSQSQMLMAGVEVNEFSSQTQEQQYNKLINELRCLVCQNQNLADSNSELAQDLRKEVFSMIQKGDTDSDIVDFMVARYGDFVLYRPPFKPVTFLLWVGPFIILFLAVLFVVIFIRRNKNTDLTELSNEEVKKADDLLESLQTPDAIKGNKQ
ncbi:MAG: cytochrome c-type biogenesis protein CcmH [Gammaproteobacteria bacterium]|nr:cytochrome c-type biogenesis protein CcmH [Gammaproteobacteria bacterium]